MTARLTARLGKHMRRLRAATVEPVLGSLVNYYGLRHMSKKGREEAAKVMYVAAMAYNLKKYLHQHPLQSAGMVLAHPNQLCLIFIRFATATLTM
ncbi:transposase [Hymenobacter sp. B81]|uniref:transposase n=1 Tax=Hymenobacter sp. B81 TaxID=3344878 RepID=UPI0037DCC1B2